MSILETWRKVHQLSEGKANDSPNSNVSTQRWSSATSAT